jgi:hypothetical protein
MGSYKQYDPLDLEILDRVYEAAWARIEATEPHRDLAHDAEHQEALRHWIFTLAGSHPVDFDTLMEKVGTVPTSWLRRVVHEPPATAA